MGFYCPHFITSPRVLLASSSIVKMRNLLLALLLAYGESAGEAGVSTPCIQTIQTHGL